jgi:hypothetical protein
MDVKTYYQKIRQTEKAIPDPFTVVSSLSTDDGGKSGVLVEVPRYLAAKMIVEGSAQLAAVEEVTAFRLAGEVACKAASEAAVAGKLEVTMVPSDELKKLTDDLKKLKTGVKVAKD